MEIKIGDRIFVVVREEEPMEAAIVPAEVTAIAMVGFPIILWKQVYPASNGRWLREDEQKNGSFFANLLDARLHLIGKLQEHHSTILTKIDAKIGEASIYKIEPMLISSVSNDIPLANSKSFQGSAIQFYCHGRNVFRLRKEGLVIFEKKFVSSCVISASETELLKPGHYNYEISGDINLVGNIEILKSRLSELEAKP